LPGILLVRQVPGNLFSFVMKAVVFSLGLLVPCFGLAQNTTRFSKLYDYNDRLQVFRATIEVDAENYFFCGVNIGNWWSDFFIWNMQIDQNGDTLSTAQIKSGDSSTYYIGRYVLKMGSNFYISGTKSDDIAGVLDAYLMKLDAQGKLVKETIYGSDKRETIDCMAVSRDGHLVLAGASHSFGDSTWGNVYMIKTDTTGEVIWQKSIGVNNYPERCWSMDTTADGGFILAGIQGPGGQQDGFIMKVDSVGNVVWKKIFGNNDYDDNVFPRIRVLQNGDILLTTGLRVSENVIWAYIKRLNALGETIWEKYYPGPQATSWFDFSRELSDGSLVMNGGLTEFDSLAANWRERATLTKLNSLGQLVWQRKFHMRSDLPSYFFCMAPTSDAGFLMGGVAFREGNNRSDAWAVKVDSLGCLEPGCAGSVAAPEPGAAIGLSIRPNPVADWLTVASPEAVLLGLRLTDLSGRVLEDVQFFRQHGLREYRLSLAALPPGLYVLSVRTEKGWVGEQVVKN
jgi:hypothetical protein